MHRNDSARFVLLKVLTVATVLVALFAFFGPYDYQFESLQGVAYYYFCLVLLGIPFLFCGEKNRIFAKKDSSQNAYGELSVKGEKLLIAASILSLLSAALFAAECIRLFSIEAILAGGDFRLEFGESRSSLSRYTEILACLGPASYLIASRLDRVECRLLMPLALLSLACMGLTGLLLGARWKVFLCLLIFVFSTHFNGASKVLLPGQLKTVLRRLFVLTMIALVIYAFFILFSVRGQLAADEQYRFYYGDMPLKPWAVFLFDSTNSAIQPVYKAIDYIGQSPFVFSYLFEHYIPEHLYYGAFALRILGYVLPMVGIPFPTHSTIVQETFTGMYSGSAYGFITDFGIVFAPIAFFVVGLCLAAVERRRTASRLSSMLFPLICSMVACSPVYYLFHVGYADYVFWWFLVLYGLLTVVGAWVPFSRSGVNQRGAGHRLRSPESKKTSG